MTDARILLVDKPTEWTSHDVVGFVRKFGIKKVGHCGTLDPAATGLLILVLGKATKLSGHFNLDDKTYEGQMQLGVETTSQDRDGEIVKESDWTCVNEKLVQEVFEKFTGPQLQIPPMVSAKKINGKKLYQLARKGITVEREPQSIIIHKLTLTEIQLPTVSFTVTCSKGTYVRTLCADIGTQLGCGAYLKSLRRTQSGCFTIDNAYSLPELKTWDREKLFEKCISGKELNEITEKYGIVKK